MGVEHVLYAPSLGFKTIRDVSLVIGHEPDMNIPVSARYVYGVYHDILRADRSPVSCGFSTLIMIDGESWVIRTGRRGGDY
jgi:hypothetical protein